MFFIIDNFSKKTLYFIFYNKKKYELYYCFSFLEFKFVKITYQYIETLLKIYNFDLSKKIWKIIQ